MTGFGELFDRVAGDAGAERGIAVAHDHAERVEHGWSDKARRALEDYIRAHPGETFIAPVVRKWAEKQGLPAPASNMAWGHVFKKASKLRIIRACGYTTYGDKTMNTQSVQLWIGVLP